MKMRALSLLAATLLSGTAAQACGPDSDCVVGERTYRYVLPDTHDGAAPVGAIVFAHGYKGSAAGLMRNKSLRRMISEMGLAFIALKSKGPGWDLPNGPRDMASTGASEFAYVEAVLQDVANRAPIDRDRLMATGFSAGGMITWNLACYRPDLFAGFAPVAGTFWLEAPSDCAVPAESLVHIHGDSDRTVPLGGRQIGPTRQGDVGEALTMYGRLGAFSPVAPSQTERLDCANSANAAGEILEFCLFEGGHSFRSEFVRYAWDRLEAAGQL